MITTLCVTKKRQLVLPKEFCSDARIEPGSSLRVARVGKGIYLTPIEEPTRAEFAAIMKATGMDRSRKQTKKDLETVAAAVKKTRAEKNGHRRR